MNGSYQPLGGEYVRKTFPHFFIADTGKIVFGFCDFHQRQKSASLLYAFRNCGQGLVHRVEICPALNLKAKVFLLVFISLASLWPLGIRPSPSLVMHPFLSGAGKRTTNLRSVCKVLPT